MFILLIYSKVREEINKIIQRAQGSEQHGGGGGGGGGGFGEPAGNIEILIPGNKVGLVIGKSGETIKQLQVGLFYMVLEIYENKLESQGFYLK